MEWSQNHKVSKEEVIAKLKDDGDFDRLRRKIIQKLKNNEELRENIISIVKQSEALNRPGAENMKPRQLSDDIYQEVGSSDDGMKSEITETVHSVYNKLANPEENAECESSARVVQVQIESNSNGLVVGAANGTPDGVFDNELKEPPGFSLSRTHQENNNDELQRPPAPDEKGAMTERQEGTPQLQDKMDTEDVDHVVAPRFSADAEHKQACESDEDPDVPPGFG